jgi:hypothetical protein
MDIIKKIEDELTEETKYYMDEIFLFSLKELLINSKERIELNNERILQSRTIENREYSIYTTLINKNEILFYEKILFPVLNKDMENKNYYNLNENRVCCARIFVNIPYSEINDFIGKTYNGNVKINNKYYSVKFKVSLVNQYFEKIHEIYELFMKNKIGWKTVNMPYIYKFFDISMVNCPKDMPSEGEIEEYSIECGKSQIEKDIIPVWNLKKYTLNSELFVRPIIERINYEYKINISEERKILLESYGKEINYVYKDGENIIFVLDEKIDEMLTIYEFMESRYFESESEYQHGIYNNKNSHILKAEKSKKEIINFLNKINLFSNIFTVEDIFFDGSGYKKVISYECNGYIKSEFEIKNRRKQIFLLLNKKKENIFWEDGVSYLISEINYKIKELEFLPVVKINEG